MVHNLNKILVKALGLGLFVSCQSQKLGMDGRQAHANNAAAVNDLPDVHDLANEVGNLNLRIVSTDAAQTANKKIGEQIGKVADSVNAADAALTEAIGVANAHGFSHVPSVVCAIAAAKKVVAAARDLANTPAAKTADNKATHTVGKVAKDLSVASEKAKWVGLKVGDDPAALQAAYEALTAAANPPEEADAQSASNRSRIIFIQAIRSVAQAGWDTYNAADDDGYI